MINKNLLNRFIGEALIYKASEKGLTQKDISILLNISESFLSDSIHGRKKFNVKHLYLIINELDINPTFIFPNESTFELIKNSLNYNNFNDFINDLNNQIYKEMDNNEQ